MKNKMTIALFFGAYVVCASLAFGQISQREQNEAAQRASTASAQEYNEVVQDATSLRDDTVHVLERATEGAVEDGAVGAAVGAAEGAIENSLHDDAAVSTDANTENQSQDSNSGDDPPNR